MTKQQFADLIASTPAGEPLFDSLEECARRSGSTTKRKSGCAATWNSRRRLRRKRCNDEQRAGHGRIQINPL